MSTDYAICGIKPADERHKKMCQIAEICYELGIDTPDEVDEYFDGDEPSELGVKMPLLKHECCTNNPDGWGYDIDVRKLPKDVKIIRFYSW
jgi:hypothetical protein